MDVPEYELVLPSPSSEEEEVEAAARAGAGSGTFVISSSERYIPKLAHPRLHRHMQ